MLKITFNYPDGISHVVETTEGNSVMMAAYLEGLPGIEGACGGVAACGTCHIVLSDDWMNRCGEIDAMEEKRLQQIPERGPNSRLACQITAEPALDGLVVLVPHDQAPT